MDTKSIPRGVKAALLGCLGIAGGFAAREILNVLMQLFPGQVKWIDTIGQFTVGLAVVWFCVVPIFRDYGVIRNTED